MNESGQESDEKLAQYASRTAIQMAEEMKAKYPGVWKVRVTVYSKTPEIGMRIRQTIPIDFRTKEEKEALRESLAKTGG